jgi:hypothetical protein
MIKFDLERALAGEEVITRDGDRVTQTYVFKYVVGDSLFVVKNEGVYRYNLEGRYYGDTDSPSDLFMVPKKLSGFVNVYGDDRQVYVYRTRFEADAIAHLCSRIACIDLSQYEQLSELKVGVIVERKKLK